MGNTKAFIPVLIITGVLKEVGWGTIIYLAAIATIDPQFYKAAVADGGGKLVQLRYITLPHMVPTISILLVLSIPTIFAGPNWYGNGTTNNLWADILTDGNPKDDPRIKAKRQKC